ncbi:MAG: c-type cytochrome [Arcticibacter sp.]
MSKLNFVCLIFSIVACCSVFYACQSENDLNYARYYTNGKRLYDTHCQNCHGGDGKGLGKLIPPLTDTVFLKAHKQKLACWIKYGTSDTMLVNHIVYSSNMPANANLPDIDIAALVTYVTNTFGNKQGLYDVNDASAHLKKCIISNKR